MASYTQGSVAVLKEVFGDPDRLAVHISDKWHNHNEERQQWIDQTKELRNYVFATDTSTTSNSNLPWKNKTTLPKLCQIRDNLHANYMAALFPNDDWLRWEAHSLEETEKAKAETIKAYMANKTRMFAFKDTISKLLYDYIDYGNCFADVDYIKNYRVEGTEEVISEQGPVVIRISPYDVVFNPLASNFSNSYHIVRALKTIGELEKEAKDIPENGWQLEALSKIKDIRREINYGSYSSDDINKAAGISIDGFGSYEQYLQSGYVEIIEFKGDIYDEDTDTYLDNYVIRVIDRSFVLEKRPNNNWLGKSSMVHGGWRYRPDNLYAMGPLDNLVGMQYRIDHLENIKADLFDLIAHPPLKLKGMVEEFDWEPLAQITLDNESDVEILKVDATALQADSQILILEQKMDEFAGAPKQAIGARTPGEKTAFEVNVLEQNASKMFQEKVINFEVNVLEPLLDGMLEIAKRNLDGKDLIGVMDNDIGVQQFIELSPEDIKGKGKVRPVGARHFAQRAQLVQNYQGMRNIFGQDPGVMNHISGIAEARMFEDALGLDKFDLVRPNVRVEEAAETQELVGALGEGLQENAMTPADEVENDVQEEINASSRPV